MSTYKYLTDATSNEPLINRAFVACARELAREGCISTVPANTSHLCELDGRQYVVLHNIHGILAVYRVRTNGVLKGLKRWPRELESW